MFEFAQDEPNRTCRYCKKRYHYNPKYHYYTRESMHPYEGSPNWCSPECREKDLTQICKRCGKPFYDPHLKVWHMTRRIYCSDECRNAANSENKTAYGSRIRKSWKLHKCAICEKLIDPMDKRYSSKSKYEATKYCSRKCRGIDKTRNNKATCPICGKKFPPYWKKQYCRDGTVEYIRTKYCSRACYNEYLRKKKDARMKPCKYCRQMYYPKLGKVPSNYCSRKCQADDLRGKKWTGTDNSESTLVTTTCTNCDCEFTYKLKASERRLGYFRVYCSDKCRLESRSKYSRETKHYCRTCGKLIESDYYRRYPLYCSKDCVPKEKHADMQQVYRLRMCKFCGKPFKAENDGQYHCSVTCFMSGGGNWYEGNDDMSDFNI